MGDQPPDELDLTKDDQPPELDLTAKEPLAEAPSVPSTAPVRTRPYVYDPEPTRERIRGVLSIGLFALVALLAILAFVFTATDLLDAPELDKLQPLFAALITLTGTALGFYFGGRSK